MSADAIRVPPRIRPGWVWGIFIFYVVTTLWALLAWVQIHLGTYPIPAEQQAILRNQSTGTMVVGLGLNTLNLIAALWLWLLRKRAFELFVTAFTLGLANMVWHVAVGGPLVGLVTQSTLMIVITVFSLIVGWCISLAICLYAWNLRKRGVLQ